MRVGKENISLVLKGKKLNKVESLCTEEIKIKAEWPLQIEYLEGAGIDYSRTDSTGVREKVW